MVVNAIKISKKMKNNLVEYRKRYWEKWKNN